MLNEKLRSGLRAFVISAVVFAPGTALAHAYVMQPPPRDVGNPNLNARAHKTGPCGGIARTNKPTNYATGATIAVKFQETIDHAGCFQIAFSPGGDKDFVNLAQIVDGANTPANMIYTANVKLPDGVTCKECTLVVRQLMREGLNPTTCALPYAVPPPNDTYYSCADICVGPDCVDGGAPDPADAGPADASTGADGGSSSGGPVTVPTDGGGKTVPVGDDGDDDGAPNLRSGEGGGCSVALGATSGATFGVAAGLIGLALVRRRRRK